MVSLLRQIIQNNPLIKVIKIDGFSSDKNSDENMGELVLTTLLSSNIESITKLNLSRNSPWFKHPERSGNVDLLAEFISKQAGLQHLNLAANFSSSNAT